MYILFPPWASYLKRLICESDVHENKSQLDNKQCSPMDPLKPSHMVLYGAEGNPVTVFLPWPSRGRGGRGERWHQLCDYAAFFLLLPCGKAPLHVEDGEPANKRRAEDGGRLYNFLGTNHHKCSLLKQHTRLTVLEIPSPKGTARGWNEDIGKATSSSGGFRGESISSPFLASGMFQHVPRLWSLLCCHIFSDSCLAFPYFKDPCNYIGFIQCISVLGFQ